MRSWPPPCPASGRAPAVPPRWLRYAGIALAITITASGVAYLLLLQGLASLAVLPAAVLLLAFITGTGITLGTRPQAAPRRPCHPHGDGQGRAGPDHGRSPQVSQPCNLRLLRERQGMSQVKLAQEVAAWGWSWRQQTVTRVENGQRMIRFGEATALAEILHTPLERFTRPVSEANDLEKVRAASVRLRESCEAVAAAVCRLLDAQPTAERL